MHREQLLSFKREGKALSSRDPMPRADHLQSRITVLNHLADHETQREHWNAVNELHEHLVACQTGALL